jgi:cobalamin biosynthesis protein CobT
VARVKSPASHRQFPEASGELADSEIALLYGSVIDEALSQFCQDPSYLVEMATSGSQVARRRSSRS